MALKGGDVTDYEAIKKQIIDGTLSPYECMLLIKDLEQRLPKEREKDVHS